MYIIRLLSRIIVVELQNVPIDALANVSTRVYRDGRKEIKNNKKLKKKKNEKEFI